jgi:hypothetical protein
MPLMIYTIDGIKKMGLKKKSGFRLKKVGRSGLMHSRYSF